MNGQWLGSLNSFEPGDGYWLIANEPFVFEYNDPQGASLARENVLPPVPEEFSYYQSIYQSFYFAKDIILNNNDIEIGDWVLHNGETIVGSRMWMVSIQIFQLWVMMKQMRIRKVIAKVVIVRDLFIQTNR